MAEKPVAAGEQHAPGEEHESQEDKSAMLRTIHDASRDDMREMQRQNAPIPRPLQSGPYDAAPMRAAFLALIACIAARRVFR